MNKICKYCGKSFKDNTRNKNKVYCSNECYTYSKSERQKKENVKKCKICFKEFTPNSNRQVCCSADCSKVNDKNNNKKTQKKRDRSGNIRVTKKKRLNNKENGVCYECGDVCLVNTHYCEMHYYKMLSSKAMRSDKYWKELKKKYEEQNARCFYTGDVLIHGINSSIDHIVPKSSNKENVYTINNLVWCTREVNLAKRHTSLENFIALCKKVSGIACGDVGVSQVDEAGTVLGRSLRS